MRLRVGQLQTVILEMNGGTEEKREGHKSEAEKSPGPREFGVIACMAWHYWITIEPPKI